MVSKACVLFGALLTLHCDQCNKAKTLEASPVVVHTDQVIGEAQTPYILRSDEELRLQLQAALRVARQRETQVLLVFGAEWCPDCREVARVLDLQAARTQVQSKFEVVHINVGRFDRHVDLLRRFHVERIATLVVLDGEGRRMAQTTMEPVSNGTDLTPEALLAWLNSPVDPPAPVSPSSLPNDPATEPLFPAEIVR